MPAGPPPAAIGRPGRPVCRLTGVTVFGPVVGDVGHPAAGGDGDGVGICPDRDGGTLCGRALREVDRHQLVTGAEARPRARQRHVGDQLGRQRRQRGAPVRRARGRRRTGRLGACRRTERQQPAGEDSEPCAGCSTPPAHEAGRAPRPRSRPPPRWEVRRRRKPSGPAGAGRTLRCRPRSSPRRPRCRRGTPSS